ncbi:hypothetical protein [Chryseobacterium echinoideorum]|uniref:hypothetical protein n=1 Tax=Chryseobacterium echinoideorum TaxID=1549648 RepID=UPI0011855131|nr:hypothetical protein [Chryseobacterium echinoideorum]
MKILIVGIFTFSGLLSAQTEIKPLPIDRSKFLDKKNTVVFDSISKKPLDSSIAKLYKMPVHQPEKTHLYSAFKAQPTDSTKHKMPNALEPALKSKIASK